MHEVAATHQKKLKKIKENIRKTITNDKHNIDRFHEFEEIAFKTALNAADRSALTAYEKPIIEFNITNSPISRLCGEFSKQEPAIYVEAAHGAQVDPKLLEIVQGHITYILSEAAQKNVQYYTYRHQLAGGFSSFKIVTEYAHSMSFDQVVRLERALYPTFVGYDPAAKEVTKCDASFYFEILPMTENEFNDEYPDVDTADVTFRKSTNASAFNWSFTNKAQEKILIVAHYYEVKKTKVKIVQTANHEVMTEGDYREKMEEWNAAGMMAQFPAIIGEPRSTYQTTICRYSLIENKVIKYEETDFEFPNYIFVDGDSIMLKNGDCMSMQQFTKPYIYHTKGLQRMVNLAGQAIANDFEGMVMHKFMVAEESLPSQDSYLDAYTDVQRAQTLVYKSMTDDGTPIPPPREVARVGLPQEVISTFNNCMGMLQNILGTYDASLGIKNNDLSGIAIVEGATQSNSVSMPYVVNFMQALNQCAKIILSVLPKYYVTPRTIPVISKEGERGYREINHPGTVKFDYDPNTLQVRIEAGVGFEIAKNQALNQIVALMRASTLFGEFMNTQGLDILIDNMTFHGVDIVKERAKEFMKEKQEQAQKNSKMPNPEVMDSISKLLTAKAKVKETENDALRDKTTLGLGLIKEHLQAEQIKVEQKKADAMLLGVLVEAGESEAQIEIAERKAQAEEDRTAAELQMETSGHLLDMVSHEHRNTVELLELADKISREDEKNSEQKNKNLN